MASWSRFVAPYYVLNALALLSYAVVRELFWTDKLAEREGFMNLAREHEIFLLAAGSFAVNYRKKATVDGVIALLFLYGKMAVLAAYYYMDRRVCGWYFVYIAILFVAVNPPKFDGPTNVVPLTPASFERLVTRGGGDGTGRPKKDGKTAWLVYFAVDWSDHCRQHDPMIAELSLKYASETLQFGQIDANKHSDLAEAHQIEISTTSWQLPTLILFQRGEEVFRLPQIKPDGKVVKTILDKPGVTAVFRLPELSEGKSVSFPAADAKPATTTTTTSTKSKSAKKRSS